MIVLIFAIEITGDIFEPSKSVDGDMNTFSLIKSKNATVFVNLGKGSYVEWLRLFWKEPPYGLEIFSSVDGVSWRNVFSGKKIEPQTALLLKGRPVRVFKMVVNGPAWLCELDLTTLEDVEIRITNFSVAELTEKEAVFRVKVSLPCSVRIAYGEKAEEVRSAGSVVSMEVANTHTVKLTELKSGKRYWTQAIAIDIYGDEVAKSEILEFYTKGAPEPYIDFFKVKAGVNCAVFYVVTSVPTRKKLVLKPAGWKGESIEVKEDFPEKKALIVAENLEWGRTYQWILKCYSSGGKKTVKKGTVSTKPMNLAQNMPVRGTFKNKYIGDNFTLSPPFLKRIVDGSLSYFHGMACSYDPNLMDQWVEVDLKKVYPVNYVKTYWRALCYPYSFFVMFSCDGKNYKKKEVRGLEELEVVRNCFGEPMKVAKCEVKDNARFVKIFIPKGTKIYKKFDFYNFVELLELEVVPERR